MGGSAGTIQMPDEEVDAYIPIETASERYGNMNVKMSGSSQIREMVELHQMIIEVDSDENVEATAAGIESMLKQFHKKEDYKISVPLACCARPRPPSGLSISCSVPSRRSVFWSAASGS